MSDKYSTRKKKLDFARELIGRLLANEVINAILNRKYVMRNDWFLVQSVGNLSRHTTLAQRNRAKTENKRTIGFQGIPSLFTLTTSPMVLTCNSTASERSETLKIVTGVVLETIRTKFPEVLIIVSGDTSPGRHDLMSTLDNEKYIDPKTAGHMDNTKIITAAGVFANASHTTVHTRVGMDYTAFSEFADYHNYRVMEAALDFREMREPSDD